MKKFIIYLILVISVFSVMACNNSDEVDTQNSIFSTEPVENNAFDNWLLKNFTYPYNIDFKYRMQDIENDHKYYLIPAKHDKSVALAKIIKHVWLEAYTELSGPDFIRSYVPKTFYLVGSPAYDSSGTMVLGTAEGGKKITLYNVNDLDFNIIDIELLNKYYFETMHHEFAHILHQKTNYDPSFDRISEELYVGKDWYQAVDKDGGNTIAWTKGFVTAYSTSEAREDFVENIAMYITHDDAYWNNMLQNAGESGSAIIERKFNIVYNYMLTTWGVNLDELREIVLRRQQEIIELDLSSIE